MGTKAGRSRDAGSGPNGAGPPDQLGPTADDAVDGVVPKQVVRVRNTADLVAVVRAAYEKRAPLVARGGGTLLEIGNPPHELDSIVATDGMERILRHSPDDMVVTIDAGMTLATLDRELAATGQRVALAAPNPEVATIGGLAAANFNSGIAYCFGYPRDQILGMTVVDGSGRVLRVGGQVVKNVAGYDMPRLFVGSFGTLGLIAEVTLRTQPRAEAGDNIALEFADLQSLEEARQSLFRSRLPLRSFDLEGDGDRERVRWRIRLSVEGTAKQVEYIRAALGALGDKYASSVERPLACEHVDYPANFVARFASTPSRAVGEAAMLLATACAIVDRARIVLESGGALLRLRAVCRSDAEVASLAEACRSRLSAGAGALLLERVSPSYKRHVDVWCGPLQGLSLMQRLKATFDPRCVLAPGRFVGGI